MRTPTWESSAGALALLLNAVSATQLRMADVYTITLSGGAQLRYSAADEAITLGPRLFALGPIFARGGARIGPGIAVDELQVTVQAGPEVQVNGMPLVRFIAGGGLDGARLLLERVFSAGPGAPWVGALHLFSGRIGEVGGGRHAKQLTVRSDTELLDVMVPRNVCQPGCLNTLYDSTCGVARAARQVSGAATGATNPERTTFNWALTQIGGYFALGSITMTSGANAGIARTVRGNSPLPRRVVTLVPWPFAVAVGDTFVVVPGCDKTMATCTAKFANGARFRGMPFIPVAETVT